MQSGGVHIIEGGVRALLGLVDDGARLTARATDDVARASDDLLRPSRSVLRGLDERLGAAAKLDDAVDLGDDLLGRTLRRRAAVVLDDAARPVRTPTTTRLQAVADEARTAVDDAARPGSRAAAKGEPDEAADLAARQRKVDDARIERQRQSDADLQRRLERRAEARRAENRRLEQERLERAYLDAVNVGNSLQMTWMRRVNAVWSDPLMRRRAEIGGFFDGLIAARAIRSAAGSMG